MLIKINRLESYEVVFGFVNRFGITTPPFSIHNVYSLVIKF